MSEERWVKHAGDVPSQTGERGDTNRSSQEESKNGHHGVLLCVALASVASCVTHVSITLSSFPFHEWGNWGNWNSSPESLPQYHNLHLCLILQSHTLFPHTTSATSSHESHKISYGLSLFFPPDSHKPIPVARKKNSERCGVCWLWHSGYDTATWFLDFFFFF